MTTPHKALLIQALKALKNSIAIRNNEGGTTYGPSLEIPAIAALQAAIDTPEPEPEPEPVAWLDPWTQAHCSTDYDAYGRHGIPLHKHPPAVREPLTEAEIIKIAQDNLAADPGRDGYILPISFARAIEAAVRTKT